MSDNEMRDTRDLLVRLDTKVDLLLARTGDHEERLRAVEGRPEHTDHEARIRALERAVWWALGAAAAVGGIAGKVVGFL